MLTSGDIGQSGLKDIFSLGYTMATTPNAVDHNACYRRLWELAAATSLPHMTPTGRLLTMAPAAVGHSCTFPLTTGEIFFDWISGHARRVDWR